MGFLSAVGGLFQNDEDRAAGRLNGLQRFGRALNEDDLQARTPSALMEWQAFAKMPPEQRQQYLQMKRADKVLDQGNQFGRLNPITGQVEMIAPINPKVAETPEYKAAQEQAVSNVDLQMKPQIAGASAEQSAIGTAAGTAQGNIEKKAIQAPQVLDLLNRAEKLLPEATSGGMQTVGRDVAALAGYATPGSKADTQLNVLAAGLVSNVPRMEGPQSDKDVALYKQAAGDLANSSLPTETRQAAIKTMRDLQNKYAEGGAKAKDVKTIPSDKKAPYPDVMDKMPPASAHEGRIIKDVNTGKRLKSNGKTWEPI